jgi:hypothetical protein
MFSTTPGSGSQMVTVFQPRRSTPHDRRGARLRHGPHLRRGAHVCRDTHLRRGAHVCRGTHLRRGVHVRHGVRSHGRHPQIASEVLQSLFGPWANRPGGQPPRLFRPAAPIPAGRYCPPIIGYWRLRFVMEDRDLVLKLRHGLQFILGGVVHGVIGIPILIGAGDGGCRSGSCGTGGSSRGAVWNGSSCRSSRRCGRC